MQTRVETNVRVCDAVREARECVAARVRRRAWVWECRDVLVCAFEMCSSYIVVLEFALCVREAAVGA